MPITPDYAWAESDATVRVEVPLKGQSKSKVDVFGERKLKNRSPSDKKIRFFNR